jgi:hypothetical protein
VAFARPRARLGASTAITKKKWCLYAWCVKFHTLWSFFGAALEKKIWKMARFAEQTPERASS